MTRRAPAAVVAAALLAGCLPRLAETGDRRVEDVAVGSARFRLVYSPEDAGAARQVRRALEEAAPKVGRWGGLPHPITVTIHPTHEALEAAVHQHGYDWLRGWARFGTVDLQSPRTWPRSEATARRVAELVTHELTHCAMYQGAGDELTWMYKEIPRWFSEGIASVTAGQAYRHDGIEALHAFYLARLPGAGGGVPARGEPTPAVAALPGDPLVDPEPIYQAQSQVVYGAAHHAAEFLIARHGEARVLQVLRHMGAGLRFPAAFREAIGMSEAEFASDFRRYVVRQGWRE